jgi:Na+/proline symporter
LTIASIPFGALLGVFLLGVLTRRVREPAAIAGVIGGLGTVIYVRFATPVAWTWYVLIGTTVTFGLGSLTELLWKRKSN